MIAATWATPSTSPLLAVPETIVSSVAGCIVMRALAMAMRWVSALSADIDHACSPVIVKMGQSAVHIVHLQDKASLSAYVGAGR